MAGVNGEENTQTVAGAESADSGATTRVMQHTVNGNHKAPYLCSRCETLRLSVECFTVQSRSLREIVKPTSFRLMSTTAPTRFGTLGEIITTSKAGCSLCDLLLRSTANKQGDVDRGSYALTDLESAICTLGWEVDGREMFENQDDTGAPTEKRESPRGLTRRIHVRWSHGQLKDSYLVFVASERLITASDAERVWNPNLLFLGRQIGLRGNIQARVKSWIDLCQEKHQGPCITPYWEERSQTLFRAMTTHAYFGVIDVLNMQLTQLPQPASINNPNRAPFDLPPAHKVPQYVALSYVWGDTPSYRTLLENVMEHRMHGGLDKVFHKLPKVIKDAIDLVRRLGFQYLWVDSLCIIQDSARSWTLNAYKMDLIYGNAVFTICAADGSNASTGLEAMDEATGTGSGDQHIANCTEDVRLMVSRPPEMYIKSSKWNTRAWTFQERLLSRRCLIFTGSRVYFQCRSTGMSEDIYADREGAGWSLDFMDAPLQTFRQLPLRSIWVYMKSVELYTARELTKDKDILAAFSGVANLMRQTMNAPFIFGLPTSHFDLALLWDHPRPVQRRIAADNASQRETIEFPSWSWSGWVGAAAGYRRDMHQGCLDNVNEWLETRTWIRWHIRDGNGDIRPLWDPAYWEVDASEQEKWKGYGASRSSGSMLFQRQQRGKRISTFGISRQPPPPPVYIAPPTHPGYAPPTHPGYAPPTPGYAGSPPHRYAAPPTLNYANDRTSTPTNPSSPNHHDTVRPELSSRSSSPSVSDTSSDRSSGSPIDAVGDPENVVSMDEPADRTTHVDTRTETIYQGRSTHESMPQSQPALHGTVDKLMESQQNQAPLADATTKAISMLSTGLNLVYLNEIGRFLIDILSALIRLAKVFLGVHVSPSDMSANLRVEIPRASEVQRSASQSEAATTPPSGDHDLHPTNLRKIHINTSDSGESRERRDEALDRRKDEVLERRRRDEAWERRRRDEALERRRRDEDLERRRSVRFVEGRRTRTQYAARPMPSVQVPSERHMLRHDHPSPRQDSYRTGPRPNRRQSMTTGSRPLHRISINSAERQFHDLAFQPDSKVEPEHTESRPSFQITLSEYPYPPVIAPYLADHSNSRHPLMPILQFWTWHTFLYVQCPSHNLEATSLIRCNVADTFSDWCGSIVLDSRWISKMKTAKQEFIALSEAKKFTYEECETWSYYVPKEREESEWDLFYVLLIVWKDGRWERVGLGKVFREAFKDATWKEIVLA